MKPLDDISALGEWAKTQSGPYDWEDATACAVFCYFGSRGCDIVRLGMYYWQDNNGQRHNYDRALDQIAQVEPWTYEALAERCEEAVRTSKTG